MLYTHLHYPPYYSLEKEEKIPFSSLCEELGIHAFLERLYWHYNKFTKISRILCFTIEKNSNVLFPIEDMNEGVSVLPNPYKDLRKLFDFSEEYLEDKSKVYLMQYNSSECREYLEYIDPNHKSALLLLLYNSSEFISYVQVFSNNEHAFTVEHARILMETREALRLAVEERYYRYNLREEMLPEYTADSLTLLQMCENLKSVMKKVEFMALSNRHVTIIGETGVGKELFAEAIHALSPRKSSPLIKINCGAISESLVDSELFGYERGAFTGAINTHAGYFEQADGGTLFLDEVGELTPATQVRLLRVLDRGEIRRVGGMRTIKLNVRVVAATHRDLKKEVDEGRFREDLWYRLCVSPIHIPPLRERHDDILTLIKYFIGIKTKGLDVKPVPLVDTAEMYRLIRYPWKGNVRQLEYAIEYALLEYKAQGKEKSLHITLDPIEEKTSEKISQDFTSQILTLHQLNKQYIEHVLTKCKGKISGKNGAAHILDVPVSTLRAKIQKYDIDPKKKYS